MISHMYREANTARCHVSARRGTRTTRRHEKETRDLKIEFVPVR